MDEQMQMAFMNEGGLKDDGMEKDPVSGNEVPSGSMAKEVRDDIPAQLSEGEYIVPADVVRYYGVKFFEDLRERAKIGLQDMEMNGRIGGEPVPAGGPMNDEELSPEEMQAIQEMMGMSEGGSINALKTQQELLEQPPAKAQGNPVMMADGGEVKGYSPGGLEQSFLDTGQQAVNRGFVGFPLGSTIFPSEKTGQTVLGPVGTQVATTGAIDTAITGTAGTDTSMLTTVTLYGPNGEIVTLTLPTDQARYDQLISEGYTTEMPVAGAPVVKSSGSDDDDKITADPNSWMDKFSYDDFDKLNTQTSDTLKKAPVGGAIGAFINGKRAAEAAANIIILKANTPADNLQGQQTIRDLEASWDKFVNDDIMLRNLPKEFINGDRLAKDIVLNNPGKDIGLTIEAKDLFGNDIFKDKDDFNNFMGETASEGMEFDPTSGSYKRKKDRSPSITTTTSSVAAAGPQVRPTPPTVSKPSKLEPATNERKSLDIRKAEAQTRIDAKKRRDKRKKAVTKAKSISKDVKGKGAKAVSATQKAGPFNKGGLMAKGKNK